MGKIMDRIKKFPHTESGESFLSVLLAILAGVGFGFLLMVIFGFNDSLEGLWIIITGGFRNGASSFGEVLAKATPLIIAGLSVGFAFKTGLFNIGAAGQLSLGAFAAVFVGVRWTFLPGHLHWIVAVLAAMFIGAIWGLIPGLLKALFNVHEVVASIMLNYIGMYLTILGVKTYVFNSLRSESLSVASNAVIPNFGLDKLFPNSTLTGGLILALIAVIVVYIILEKTTFGFQLKAVGFNKHAAKYAGINEKRSIILSMTIAGALAGLAGAVIYLKSTGIHIVTTYALMPEGFDGIAVALLGLSHPIGIIFAGLFFGYIRIGGFYLQSLNYELELIDIIMASIVYFSALAVVFKQAVHIIFPKKEPDSNANAEEEPLVVANEGGDE